jgi:hypothetical protein
MQMKNNRNDLTEARFAACTRGARLLSIYPVKAGCVSARGSISKVQLFAGVFFRDGFTPGLPKKSSFNALRNFSRESSAAPNSKQKHTSNKDAFAPKL